MVFMARFYNKHGIIVHKVTYINFKSFSHVFSRVCSMVDDITDVTHYTLIQIK